MHDVEIKLTKGQGGLKQVNACSYCNKYIAKRKDSVRIGLDYTYEWVHLQCFIKMCEKILEKAGYSCNPSKRDSH